MVVISLVALRSYINDNSYNVNEDMKLKLENKEDVIILIFKRKMEMK